MPLLHRHGIAERGMIASTVSSQGETACKNAQRFVRALKEERPIGVPRQLPSDYAARRLAEETAASLLREFFLDEPLLVPVPRSSLSVEGGIWPAFNIAAALVRNGTSTVRLMATCW